MHEYQVGDLVEVRCPDFEDRGVGWHPGVVKDIDNRSSVLPYAVYCDANTDGTGWDWIRNANIRPAAAHGVRDLPASIVWQLKAEHDDEWITLDSGHDGCSFVFPSFGGEAHVQLRIKPKHTAEEILAKLREELGGKTSLVGSRVYQILNGEF